MRIYGDENNIFLLNEIGERIKDIRISRNMTQEDVAENAGVSLSTVKRIESGKGSTMDNFLRILRLFDLIQNLEILIPGQQQTAEEIYRNIPKRQRASREKEEKTAFKWGDEL